MTAHFAYVLQQAFVVCHIAAIWRAIDWFVGGTVQLSQAGEPLRGLVNFCHSGVVGVGQTKYDWKYAALACVAVLKMGMYHSTTVL